MFSLYFITKMHNLKKACLVILNITQIRQVSLLHIQNLQNVHGKLLSCKPSPNVSLNNCGSPFSFLLLRSFFSSCLSLLQEAPFL